MLLHNNSIRIWSLNNTTADFKAVETVINEIKHQQFKNYSNFCTTTPFTQVWRDRGNVSNTQMQISCTLCLAEIWDPWITLND